MKLNRIRLLHRCFPLLTFASYGFLTCLSAQAQGPWTKAAPVPEMAEQFTSTAANGKIYLVGGTPATDLASPKATVQEYDPATDRWTMKKPMPSPAREVAATEFHGKIYVFGGGVQRVTGGPNQYPTNNSWEYDPGSDSWRAIAPMPTARIAAVACEVGGKIYVIGGASVHPGAKLASLSPNVPHRSLDVNEAYDPSTNRWESHSPMPTARNHAAAGVVNGKIYVIGGRLGSASETDGSSTDVVEVFDPAADSWGAAGLRMPTARSAMSWATWNNRIYVSGGEIMDAHMSATVRAVEAYDPASNQWSTLPTLSIARYGAGSAAIGDRLFVIGGHVQAGSLGGDGANTDLNETFQLTGK